MSDYGPIPVSTEAQHVSTALLLRPKPQFPKTTHLPHPPLVREPLRLRLWTTNLVARLRPTKRLPTKAQNLPSHEPATAYIKGLAPPNKVRHPLHPEVNDLGKKGIPRRTSVGLELAREINEAAAVPAGLLLPRFSIYETWTMMRVSCRF